MITSLLEAAIRVDTLLERLDIEISIEVSGVDWKQ